MIKITNLNKVYGKKNDAQFSALSNVNLELPDRKTIAIIGKSGSGKSTLLHLLGGLDSPSSGEIIVNDINLSSQNKKQMDSYRSQQLGFVYQSFFVEANQTCYQNIALPLEINRIPLMKRAKLIETALRDVELLDKIKVKAGLLSGGQKQRLAIARAIVLKPKIILADEPTGNLDSATGDKIIQLLFDLFKKNNSTLVIVTHDQDIAKLCDIRINLADGSVTKVEGI